MRHVIPICQNGMGASAMIIALAAWGDMSFDFGWTCDDPVSGNELGQRTLRFRRDWPIAEWRECDMEPR